MVPPLLPCRTVREIAFFHGSLFFLSVLPLQGRASFWNMRIVPFPPPSPHGPVVLLLCDSFSPLTNFFFFPRADLFLPFWSFPPSLFFLPSCTLQEWRSFKGSGFFPKIPFFPTTCPFFFITLWPFLNKFLFCLRFLCVRFSPLQFPPYHVPRSMDYPRLVVLNFFDCFPPAMSSLCR